MTEKAKANAVGVGCVRCARAHLPFALRGAPAQSFVVAQSPGSTPRQVDTKSRNVHVLDSCAGRDGRSLVLQPRGCVTSLPPKGPTLGWDTVQFSL